MALHDGGHAGFRYAVFMNEPNPRSSRLVLAAGLVAAIVVGGGGFLLGKRSVAPTLPPQSTAPISSAPVPPPPPKPVEPQILGRAELIALAGDAADATARGVMPPANVTDAVGQRFSIALPFGCAGPAPEDSNADMRWRYDEAAQALRLHVTPASWTAADWWQRTPPADIEGVEGFWIARPWIGTDACPRNASPAVVSGAEPVTLTGQTLAIGQLLGAQDARQGRRDGKPYTAVIKMAPDALNADRGFRLKLEGQLAVVENKAAVRCRQPGGAEQQPVCLIGARIDEVVIENGASGAELARWSVATRAD